MAPLRALSALAAVAALGSVNAVVYNYNNGGQDWGTLAGNGACNITATSQQSPIDVPTSNTTAVVVNESLPALNIKYGKAASWALEVTANYLEVGDIDTITTPGVDATTANTFTDGLTLADGTFVPLNQFHFHSPSEHTINGMHYPLEMHMVHKLFRTNTSTAAAPVLTAGNTPGATLQRAAVIGIMFAYDPLGANGTFMGKLAPIIQNIAVNVTGGAGVTSDTSGAGAQFDLMADVFSVIGNTNYFTYAGSLTTPPCSEGITWFLMQNPMYASPAQILGFTRTLAIEQKTAGRGSDNRLVQPLLTRTVTSSVKLN